MGPAVLHPAGQVPRAGGVGLLEGLEVPLCCKVPQAGGVHRRREARHGAADGATGDALRGGQ